MKLGNLEFLPVEDNWDLIVESVKQAIEQQNIEGVFVSEIDTELSDTAAFCEKYDIGLDVSVNCVIVEAKRADKVWYAACMIPANVRADINGIVRRELGARKISFAPMDTATGLTNMEFGAINPIGLPADWPILVDENASKLEYIVIGSGIRKSKLLIPGSLFAELPNTKILALTKQT